MEPGRGVSLLFEVRRGRGRKDNQPHFGGWLAGGESTVFSRMGNYVLFVYECISIL